MMRSGLLVASAEAATNGPSAKIERERIRKLPLCGDMMPLPPGMRMTAYVGVWLPVMVSRYRTVLPSAVLPDADCSPAQVATGQSSSSNPQRMAFMQPTIADRGMMGLNVQVRLWPIADILSSYANVCLRGLSRHPQRVC